jgi:hypothetical protein
MIRVATLILLAGPAMAQDNFSLPAGCTGYVTVQKRGCVVSHLFTCQNDPAGHQRRVDMTEGGLAYLGTIDAETNWIESTHIAAGYTETLVPGAADPASFTQLLSTGHDDWDFVIAASDGYNSRNVGTDDIIDPNVVIDGVALQMTNFVIRVSDPVSGDELWRAVGHEYIHPEWRTFLSGIRTITTPTETYDTDNSPVEFAFPGEAGFLTSKPRYDCSVPIAGDLPTVTLVSAIGN